MPASHGDLGPPLHRSGTRWGPRVPAPRRPATGASAPRSVPVRHGDIGSPYSGGASRHVAPLRRKSPSQARRRSVVASLPLHECFAYGHADNQAIFPVTGSVRSTCRNTQCINGLRASVRFGSVVAATRTKHTSHSRHTPHPTARPTIPTDHRPPTRRLGVVGHCVTRCIARRPARSPHSHHRPPIHSSIPSQYSDNSTRRPSQHHIS